MIEVIKKIIFLKIWQKFQRKSNKFLKEVSSHETNHYLEWGKTQAYEMFIKWNSHCTILLDLRILHGQDSQTITNEVKTKSKTKEKRKIKKKIK